MKNRSFKILSFAILAAVALYFGVEAYRYVTDPHTTTLAYASQSNDSIHLDGWIIRDEETFSSSAAALRHTLNEGEHIGAGQTIAVAYDNKDALSTMEEIDAQELQLQQLEFALSTYLDADAALKLDNTISDSLLQLQGSLSQGDYTAAADQVTALKAAILKRNHSYSSDQEIRSHINSVKESIAKLTASLSHAKQITAPKAGTYSAVCDGYETTLTTDLLAKLTPSTLNDIHSATADANVGKLIYGSTWYYAANLPTKQADELQEGQTASLRFAKGLEQDIPVTVFRISPQEKEQKTVIFSANRYVAQTAQLRHQQAELILARYSGIRVPANALRVKEDGQPGLYCAVGMKTCFKPVQVVYQGDGYTLVRPASDATGSSILRSGDEVIITASGLESGQVLTP